MIWDEWEERRRLRELNGFGGSDYVRKTGGQEERVEERHSQTRERAREVRRGRIDGSRRDLRGESEEGSGGMMELVKMAREKVVVREKTPARDGEHDRG